MTEDEYNEMLDELESDGCITRDGDRMTVNWELLELLHPAIHSVFDQALMEDVSEAINNLTDLGMIEMSFRVNDDGGMEPVYRLSPLGMQFAEQLGWNQG